jgi:sugar phosphate isomerase/epimerase
MTIPPLAVQLYSVRDALAADYSGVLSRIADMGYAGVEMAGSYGSGGPADAAAFIRSLGLEIVGAHLGLPDDNDFARTIATAHALGTSRWVVPWVPPEEFQTRARVQTVIDRLNSAAAAAKDAGLTLFYHNHWFEFEATPGLDGDIPFNLMLEKLDPAVQFEIDLYWVKTGGSDPAAILTRLGSRASLLHVKDGPTNLTDAMVAVGDGVMNYPDLLPDAAAEWLIVELDRCDTDVLTAIRRSHDYLTGKGLAHGRA